MKLKAAAVRATCAVLVVLAAGCGSPPPLDAQRADSIVRSQIFMAEPVYAEVPQSVGFGPSSPKDEYDGKAVETLARLERAGLVTVAESHAPDGASTYQAKVTAAGFRVLGTMPSVRGPVYRAQICEKRIIGTRNFVRHPSDPTVGRIEIVWEYANPTSLYEHFETKMNKPLKKQFVSVAAIHWDHGWKFELTVPKAES